MRFAYPADMTWLVQLICPVNGHPQLCGYRDYDELLALHSDDPFDLIFLPQDALHTAAALRDMPPTFELAYIGNKRLLSPEAILFQPIGILDASATVRDISQLLYRFHSFRTQNDSAYLLQTRESSVRIPLSDIRYFSSRGHYAFAHTASDAEPRIHLRKLEEISAQLPQNAFIRCHQRYLVNLMHIAAYNHKEMRLHLSDGSELPISKRYSSQVANAILGCSLA